MATKTDSTSLEITPREPGSSRATRRLRREGRIPGVLYGRGQDPVAFDVDSRELRNALAGSGAVLDLALQGKSSPAVLKDTQIHPVRGEIMHVDLLRVDLTQTITATVPVELVGAEDAPGVREGGVLEHVTREVLIEALPGDIPESITFDVSGLQINDTVTLDALEAPEGVTISHEGDEAVLATVTPPRLEQDLDEIEAETAVVGEEGAAAEEAGEASEGDEPAADASE
ncbi:MAG: large subunit ribosomal protein [Solirubrobacteraceae bacterium]|jgi:large subunit ribosomal protein L25|nr:large subunit ribosomal protein [Solirubrobacteraceae bacterium]